MEASFIGVSWCFSSWTVASFEKRFNKMFENECNEKKFVVAINLFCLQDTPKANHQ